jgi:type IV pilus assembly protein PilQ
MINRLESRMMRGRCFLAAATLSMGLFAPAWAQSQNMIRAVTASQSATGEEVRVELNEALASVPKGFAIQSPPRVAVDLPKVGNGLGTSNVALNQGNVRSVSVASTGDRTRLVLNLRQPATYHTEVEGKTLKIALETSAAPSTASTVHFADSQNSEQLAIRDIDFRRGSDGAGRVIVGLANSQVGVDLQQQGQNLVVEFLRSALPEALRRKLDVSDFGTPVQSITATQTGDKVRLVVQPKGAWEHSAYQTDNQFVLEVRPVAMDPNKAVQGPGYHGEKLSLNFQSIEIRSLLQVIADFTNFNVVTSDSVTGNVTLRLKDVPWDQALDIILQAKGLGMRKSGNVLWIAPKEELATKEQNDLEAKKKIADLEPVRTQSFQLNYTKAEEVAQALIGNSSSTGGSSAGTGSNVTRILSSRGSVLAEKRTNQLFVSDIPSKLEEVAMMIQKIDIPMRQVLIEARIVEASDSWGRALGVKLGTSSTSSSSVGNLKYSIGGNYDAVGYQTGQQTSDTSYDNTTWVSLPASTSSFSDASAATFAVSLFGSSASRFLNLELSALESESKGKVISSPRVITTDQTKASVEQGVEIPYQEATSSGATSVSFKKASLKLEVTPQITPEGSVILTLDVSNDSRGDDTTAGPAINTKRVSTQVLVENGGTVVIGGIFQETISDSVDKVPLLGDIPILGNLFKTTTKYDDRTELLMFITPKIVNDHVTIH